MTRARIFQALAFAALLVGLAAVVASAIPGGGRLMGLFMIDHFLVLFVVLAASWVLRRAQRSGGPLRWPGARRLFAPWLVATAGVAVAAMLALHFLAPIDLSLPQGHHLRLVANDFATVAPLTQDGREDQAFGVFAHVWVIFALAGLAMWHVVGIRDEQGRAPTTAAQQPVLPIELPRADAGLARWRPVLVLGIWVAGLAWSVGAMTMLLPRQLCAAPFPWPFAILPLVFFPLSGLFAKRAPYDVPWFAEMVDSRFGAGAWSRFLVSLKPLLLIGVGTLCAAVALVPACADSGAAFPFVALFMASGGVGFVLLYVVLRVRRMDGV